MKKPGISGGGNGEDRRDLTSGTSGAPEIAFMVEEGVTSTMLINKGGGDCGSDIFTRVAAGEGKDLMPPRVPGDEPSSSTNSARGTLWRADVRWEKRGDDGE